MQIRWAASAHQQLRSIYEYYKEEASVAVAQKIRKRLRERTRILATQPMIGPVEKDLESFGQYRILIEQHWKIIYRITDHVRIVGIFDSRQNPEKEKEVVKD